MGIGHSYRSKLLRVYYFLSGVNKRLNNNHINFLKSIIKNQPNRNIRILESFDYMRKNMIYFKFSEKYFQNLGIYRQTKKGNLLLKLGLMLNLE